MAIYFFVPYGVELEPVWIEVFKRPGRGEYSAQDAVLDDEVMAADELCEGGVLVSESRGRKRGFVAVVDKLFPTPVAGSEAHHEV